MIRKLTLLVTVILVGGLLYFGFGKMKLSQKPKVDIYNHVPPSAIAVIQINNPFTQWPDILSNNIIWDELQVFENVNQIEAIVSELDSAILNESSKIDFKPESILLSVVPVKENEYHVIYQMRMMDQLKNQELIRFLNQALSIKLISDNNNPIFELSNNSFTLYGHISEDIISLSLSKEAVDNLVNQKQNTSSILDKHDFLTVRKTSSKNAEIRIFTQPNLLLKALEENTNSKTQLELTLLPQTSSWVELDIDIKPDEISMGGFALAVDSLNHWLTLFKNQEPIKPRVIEVLPNRTAFILHFGFSDFNSLRNKYVSRKSAEMGIDYDHQIFDWDTAYDISIQKNFIDWIDNELAFTIVEPDRQILKNDMMVWVNSSDSRTLMNRLSEMALHVVNKDQTELNLILYKDYKIQKLDIPDFLEVTLGEQFKYVTDNYFTQIEDYIVFANSPAILQFTIDRFEKGKTLNNDADFKTYSNRISGESNIYFYSNIAASPLIYKSIANKALQSHIEEQKEWLQKFQVLSLQISYETDNLYFVNNYLKYNPVYKKESNSLWELPLLTVSTAKPTLVKNHYTQATEIFIQDTNNTIYLIDNKGKILWTRDVDGIIRSEIKQIDALKNNKLQLVFNTDNRIYIIDRNGKDLSNFPINLPAVASASVCIADYDNTLDYRLIIPLVSGELFNYKVTGNRVNGWAYSNTSKKITQKIQHIKVRNKDYLIACYENGEFKALNRKGEIRIDLKSKLNFELISPIELEVGSNIDHSYLLAVTTNKEVVKINLSDKKERLFSIPEDSLAFVSYQDIDSDGAIEIVTVGKSRISAYETDGKKIFSFHTRSQPEFLVNTYSFSDKNLIGYVSSTENKVFLSNIQGELIYSFPLKGASPFSISDINHDGRFNLITIDQEGVMLNYTLDL
jgi:hypothetical protein